MVLFANAAPYQPSYPLDVVLGILHGYDRPIVIDLFGRDGAAAERLSAFGARVAAHHGSPDKTSLVAACADIVTIFDGDEFLLSSGALREAARLLRTGGRLALVSRYLDTTEPFTAMIAQMLVDNGLGESRCIQPTQIVQDLPHYGWREMRALKCTHYEPLSVSELLGFVLSTLSAGKGITDLTGMVADLNALNDVWTDPAGLAWITEASLAEVAGGLKVTSLEY